MKEQPYKYPIWYGVLCFFCVMAASAYQSYYMANGGQQWLSLSLLLIVICYFLVMFPILIHSFKEGAADD